MTSKKNEYQVDHQKAKDAEDYFESWEIGGGCSYLYTADRRIMQVLKEQFPRCATYEQRGVIIGWKFMVLTRQIPFLRRRCRTVKVAERKKTQISTVENQPLTEATKVRSAIRAKNYSRAGKAVGPREFAKVRACEKQAEDSL